MNTVEKKIAVEITPKDDAFHGSPKRISAEWWYFDAIFENGYSTHIGFKTFTRKNKGSISPIIEFYKEGKLLVEETKRHLFRRCKLSKDRPYVELFKKPVIKFDEEHYKKTGEWLYHVKMKIESSSVDLKFVGITKGWKIETDAESWTVSLPKAIVTGEIEIDGKKMKVKGLGYHDHNWNYSILTAMNYGIGWYWGKIRSDNVNIVWANIVKSSKKSEILAIINQDKKGFLNVNPENIYFKTENYIRKNRKKTPTSFSFKIDDIIDDKEIKVDIKMDVKEFHLSKVLIAPYWRYHIHNTGFISYEGKQEKVDNNQIMEYLTFT